MQASDRQAKSREAQNDLMLVLYLDCKGLGQEPPLFAFMVFLCVRS